MNRDFRKDTEGSMKKLVEIVQKVWVGICRKTVQNRAESMCRIVQRICAEFDTEYVLGVEFSK